MPKVYAHIVGPNEYKLTALQIQLELTELYIVVNTYRIAAADQKKIIQNAVANKSPLLLVIIGPLWSFEIQSSIQFIDNVTQACFIVDRVDEDGVRIALMRDRIRVDIIEGKLNLDLTRAHLENTWNIMSKRYHNYKPMSIADMTPLLGGPCIKAINVDDTGVAVYKSISLSYKGPDRAVHFNKHLDITQIPSRK